MRVHGVNLWAVLAGGVAFWLLGFVWYGLVFWRAWMGELGITDADFEGQSPAWMIVGVAIPFLTAIGLNVALRWGGLPNLLGCLRRTLILWAAFGLTAGLYVLAYQPAHSVILLAIDGLHTLIGWLIIAAIAAWLR